MQKEKDRKIEKNRRRREGSTIISRRASEWEE